MIAAGTLNGNKRFQPAAKKTEMNNMNVKIIIWGDPQRNPARDCAASPKAGAFDRSYSVIIAVITAANTTAVKMLQLIIFRLALFFISTAPFRIAGELRSVFENTYFLRTYA